MFNRKTAMIAVRLTEAQREALEAAAKRAGMNVSEYVRMLVLKDIGIIK